MKYMGSKNRIAKYILPIMLEKAKEKEITTWVEPFVGGGNMIDKVPNTFKRIGIDLNPHTISAMIGIRDYIEKFPVTISKEYYLSLKGLPPDCITSWIRFHCSFGAKFEGGYATNSRGVNYCMEGRDNLKKQSKNLKLVDFLIGSYEEYSHLEKCLIYCDPPYQGTSSYKIGVFDHDKFWQWCRDMSKNNKVFISEYNAPSDFKCVWQGEVKTNFASTRKSATHNAVEKLFTL